MHDEASNKLGNATRSLCGVVSRLVFPVSCFCDRLLHVEHIYMRSMLECAVSAVGMQLEAHIERQNSGLGYV
jgi:hypothetical protein